MLKFVICQNPFNLQDIRVRDHNHLTGKFRGAAHQKCNLNYIHSRMISVVFHNFSGYDGDFIIKNIATQFEDQGVITSN